MARDSGILYHVKGEQKVWPTSIEYQICEGQTGDFYMTDGAALTGLDGKRVTGPPNSAARIIRIGEGPWQNVTGYRDPNGETENAHGKLNLVEIVAQGENVKHYLNGKPVNAGTKAYPASGKILIQSEGAETYFQEDQFVSAEEVTRLKAVEDEVLHADSDANLQKESRRRNRRSLWRVADSRDGPAVG